MVRADVITLIGEDPSSHGMLDSYTPASRQVFAESRSVGMREAYEALSVGLHPEIVFHLELSDDYRQERQLIWNGERYRIIRSYVSGDGIELICARWDSDV